MSNLLRRFVPKHGTEYIVKRQHMWFRWHWVGVRFLTRDQARDYKHFLQYCGTDCYMVKKVWDNGFLLDEARIY